jgi:glycosyltransferase involved in cell wall biosynthesis
MRVLMVTQFWPPTIGGQERIAEDLSGELASRGHHVAVATLQPDAVRSSGSPGVEVHQITTAAGRLFRGYSDPLRPHAPPAMDPRAVAELRRLIELDKPDIVHGHDWLIHSFIPLKRRGGPGLVVTLHDQSLICANKRLIRQGKACTGPGPVKCLRCSSAYYGFPKGPAIAVGNWTMTAAERAVVDLFLPVSRAVADAARLREHGNPYSVIPNFVPTTKAPSLDPRGVPADSASPVPEELPEEFVLFLGDVLSDKGVAVLLQAHEQLVSMPLRRPPPLVLMGPIGDPGLVVAAVGEIRARNPRLMAAPLGPVRVFGPQPHEVALEALRRCTVAVVPSLLPEAFGLVALEAMRAGRPVIASNIGGLREFISDGQNGILVPPGDVSALRNALTRVLAEPALRARLGTAGKLRAEEFSAERIVPQVELAYDYVLKARRKRRPDHASPDSTRRPRQVARIGPIRTGLRGRHSALVLALAALGVAATAIPAGAWSPLRAALVLPLVLFLPGYELTNVIFGPRPPDWPERIVLALSLSLVTTALVSLVLYLTPFELTLHSWTISLALLTAAATVVAAARASPAPAKPAFELGRLTRPLPRRRVEIALTVAAVGLVAAAVALARVPLSSPSAPGYTALWLTRNRDSAAITLGVHSEEHRTTRYVLRLVVAGRITRRRLSLAPGQTWQKTLPPAQRAAASLYRAGHPGIYRSVGLAAPPTKSR